MTPQDPEAWLNKHRDDPETTITELIAEVGKLRAHLRNIRDIALCSEGVEFYAMLADRGLNGEEP
jgi:hypothetical protein